MSLRLLKRPLALRDEDHHFTTLAGDNLDVAIAWIEALEAGYRHILSYPDSGANRPVLGRADYQRMQFWPLRHPFERWLIYFQHQPEDKAVEVVRILHSSQDRERHLGSS